jgi:hypothetical protein
MVLRVRSSSIQREAILCPESAWRNSSVHLREPLDRESFTTLKDRASGTQAKDHHRNPEDRNLGMMVLPLLREPLSSFYKACNIRRFTSDASAILLVAAAVARNQIAALHAAFSILCFPTILVISLLIPRRFLPGPCGIWSSVALGEDGVERLQSVWRGIGSYMTHQRVDAGTAEGQR